MRVLVTGINGFAGRHLTDLLVREGCEITGTVRAEMPGLPTAIHTMHCDLRDAGAVQFAVAAAHPEIIFHLAAITSEMDMREQPTTNVNGTINLLEAVRSATIHPVILLAGSSAEYGFTEPGENPIAETQPLRPVTAYARSKVEQSLVGKRYFKTFGQRIVRTRAFNHLGPGQRDAFVPAAFARQIVEIESGCRPAVIRVGNLESRRDFTDVRDVVRAYWLAATHGVAGEIYNVCSGREVSGNEVLKQLMQLAGITADVQSDAPAPRPTDVPAQCGSFAKLHALTGWEPAISLDQSLRDVLEDWRKRLL